MLTPRKDDENRTAELKRREKEPTTFGSTPGTQRLAKDWSPTGLVTHDNKPLVSDPRKNAKPDKVK